MSSEVEKKIKEWRMKNRRALCLLPGSIETKSDVVKVAKLKARKLYGWDKARVLPWREDGPDGCHIVLVEPKSLPDGVVGESADEADAQGEDGATGVKAHGVVGPRQKEGERSR